MSLPRAWVVTAWQGDDGAIVWTYTPAQAKAATYRSARDADIMVKWTQLRARRAPEFDAIIPAIDMGRAYDQTYVRNVYLRDSEPQVR